MKWLFEWSVFHCMKRLVVHVPAVSGFSQAISQSPNAINCTPRRDEEVALIASNGRQVWVCPAPSHQAHLFIIQPSENGLEWSINPRMYASLPRLISHLSINLTFHQFYLPSRRCGLQAFNLLIGVVICKQSSELAVAN
jgi:hypothetical protein